MPQICLVKFAQPEDARAAVRHLLQSGIDPGLMEVMTAHPIHGDPILPDGKPTRLRTWALSGAAVGIIAGFSLATLTALAYPIPKGGMPIVAPWTVGIVTYETMMLGAVLATLAGLLIELRLPNFKALPYDPTVVDGGVLLAVECRDQSKAAVENIVGSISRAQVSWIS